MKTAPKKPALRDPKKGRDVALFTKSELRDDDGFGLQRAEERKAWDRYFAAAAVHVHFDEGDEFEQRRAVRVCAELADTMLEARRARFGGVE